MFPSVHDLALALSKEIMSQFHKQGCMYQVHVRHKGGKLFVTGAVCFDTEAAAAEIVYTAKGDKTVEQMKIALVPILSKLPILNLLRSRS
jgi:hypothetical protein